VGFSSVLINGGGTLRPTRKVADGSAKTTGAATGWGIREKGHIASFAHPQMDGDGQGSDLERISGSGR
jgi:hypothetical protein